MMEKRYHKNANNEETLLERATFFVHLHSILFYSLSIVVLPPLVAFLEHYHFWLFLVVGEHIPSTLNSWGWVGLTYHKWLTIGFAMSIPYRIFVLSIYLGEYWTNLSLPLKRKYILTHSSSRKIEDSPNV